MYRLATKCTTKKRSEKRHKCQIILMDSGIRVEYARLVCQQWHARVPYTTGQWSLNAQRCADCGRVGLRTQIRSNCWIRGPTANGFFYSEVESCDHNEYSVKILYAVRSAITAI